MRRKKEKIRYRLDLEDLNGVFRGCVFFDTLEQAEEHLKGHNYLTEYYANIMNSNKRYGTIWEVKK